MPFDLLLVRINWNNDVSLVRERAQRLVAELAAIG
jgi:hypothetical protein